MAILLGTDMSPGVVNDTLGRERVNSTGTKIEIAELDERVSAWKSFQKTREYSVVMALSEPYVKNLTEKLAMGVLQLKQSYPSLTQDELVELRAEWRGELHWWNMLVYGLDIMERRLREIEEFNLGEGKKKRGGVADDPRVNKYS